MEALQRLHNRGSISTGYDIDNSLKLEPDNVPLLYKTQSDGNKKTWTCSFWFKRTELNDAAFPAFISATSSSWATRIAIFNDGSFWVDLGYGTSYYRNITNAKIRDTAAWYHFVVAVDSTQATASDRLKAYINGNLITDWGVQNLPAQNTEFKFFDSAHTMYIGNYNNAVSFEPAGYMAEMNLIEGQQLQASDFGEFDTDTGIWKPIEYTGTYGTNGFYLDFENASSLGADASGNSNNFTLYNITSADQASDTPTNNFCTLRPAYEPTAAITLKEGATVWQNLGNSNSAFQPNSTAIGTFQLTAGKWYWECTWTNDGDRALIGIVASLADIRQTTDWQEWVWWDGYNGWISSSIIATETNPPSFDSINTIGIALDCDNQRITFSKDGGWLEANGNMNGSSPSDWRWDWTNDSDFLGSAYSNGNVTPMFGIQSDFNTHFTTANVNFGGYAATIRTAGGNSDANGYGNFAYAVPSGFYALCTKNLAEFG